MPNNQVHRPLTSHSKTYFITLEGIEGAGKTSALNYIRNYLTEQLVPFIATREPGGTPIAEKLRQLVLHGGDTEALTLDTELLLMFAGRSQHLAHVIKPALAKGQWVISDRFTDASYAYQGSGRGIEKQHIEYLEQWIQGGLYPDVVILLDISVETALQRISKRGNLDRIEQQRADFFARVREGYLAQARLATQRYQIVDAEQPIARVQEQIKQILDRFIHSYASD